MYLNKNCITQAAQLHEREINIVTLTLPLFYEDGYNICFLNILSEMRKNIKGYGFE